MIAERESVWSGFLCTIDGAKGRELERRGLPYLALDGFLGADVIPTASLAIGGLETGHGAVASVKEVEPRCKGRGGSVVCVPPSLLSESHRYTCQVPSKDIDGLEKSRRFRRGDRAI